MYRKRKDIIDIVSSFGYKVLEEYSKNKSTRVVIEDSQGYKYDVILNNLLRNKVADFVANGNPFSLDNIKIWLKKESKQIVLCENNVYHGCKKKLYFRCTKEECLEVFDMSWSNIYKGQGCPFCSGKRIGEKNNLEYLYPEVSSEWDYERNKYNPDNYTCGSAEKVFWICSVCNFRWKSRISHRVNGVGCPRCSRSKGEKRVEEWLLLNKIRFEREYVGFKDCKNINVLSFDFYLPEYNMCIEYNGEQHYREMGVWGGSDKLKRTIKNDEIKAEYCKNNDIFLLVIPYWEYSRIEEILNNISP